VGYGRLGSNTNMGDDMSTPTEADVEALLEVWVNSVRAADTAEELTVQVIEVSDRLTMAADAAEDAYHNASDLRQESTG
jgi:hypothetical protein